MPTDCKDCKLLHGLLEETLVKYHDSLIEHNNKLESYIATYKKYRVDMDKMIAVQNEIMNLVMESLKKPMTGEYALGYIMAMKKVGGIITEYEKR